MTDTRFAAVDPASVPQLRGIFEPVVTEADGPAEVVQGKIPDDLAGVYLRNGPNPRFPPIGSYTYPLDGDGMVHGVWIEDGVARYRNRFVRTPALDAEERVGRALWPGVMKGGLPDASDVGKDLAGTERDLVDINVVFHAGRYLALAESARPFEITSALDTVGPFSFGGALAKGICAHPKIDPDTGEMVVFRYDLAEPYLTWASIGPDGAVAQPETAIDVDGPYMIHDCVITARYLVLFVSPCAFDLEALVNGGSLLQWRPERGTRIAVVPRDGSAVRWIEAEPFWVWHFANGFEPDGSGETVVVDYARWAHPGFGAGEEAPEGHVERATLHVKEGSVHFETLDDQLAEFARIDDRLIGREHRYFHAAGKDPADPTHVAGEWNRLVRYDTVGGKVVSRPMGRTRLGEAVFAPSIGGAGEDDGYIIGFTFDADSLESHLMILHAGDISAEPAATLSLPQRVPFGLHGWWQPTAAG